MNPLLKALVLTGQILSALFLQGCLEEGASGDTGLDCGEWGTAHDGHCHCEDGFAFDGETCVALSDISERCTVHEDTNEEEHAQGACRCETEADCPCEGELLLFEGTTYCIPELHDE
jgi:hypothetical protein